MNQFRSITSYTASASELALIQFLLTRADALINASALLGDQQAVRRTSRLLEGIIDAPRLTRHLRREIVSLHRLLALDNVDDSQSVEAACFASIDPSSPIVEEICELTDALRSQLYSLAESEADGPQWEEIVAAA